MIHVIGDFYFRPRKLPGYRDILVKNFCYTLLFLIASIPFWRIQIFVAILVVVFFHLILEIVEHFFKELKAISELTLSALDQILHFASILFVVVLCKYNGIQIILLPQVENILKILTINHRDALKWACLLLIICKPSNIIIRKMLISQSVLMKELRKTLEHSSGL